ncbi:MAG: hypothetical protein ACREVJ_15590, partial [Gammaproteobacteria bacterium]
MYQGLDIDVEELGRLGLRADIWQVQFAAAGQCGAQLIGEDRLGVFGNDRIAWIGIHIRTIDLVDRIRIGGVVAESAAVGRKTRIWERRQRDLGDAARIIDSEGMYHALLLV